MVWRKYAAGLLYLQIRTAFQHIFNLSGSIREQTHTVYPPQKVSARLIPLYIQMDFFLFCFDGFDLVPDPAGDLPAVRFPGSIGQSSGKNFGVSLHKRSA